MLGSRTPRCWYTSELHADTKSQYFFFTCHTTTLKTPTESGRQPSTYQNNRGIISHLIKSRLLCLAHCSPCSLWFIALLRFCVEERPPILRFCSAAAAASTLAFQGALQSSESYRKGARPHQIQCDLGSHEGWGQNTLLKCDATLFPQNSTTFEGALRDHHLCIPTRMHLTSIPSSGRITYESHSGRGTTRCMLAQAPYLMRPISHTNCDYCGKHLTLSPTHNPTC